MFDDLKSILYRISELEDFEVSIECSEQKSTCLLLDVSWKKLFEIYDNGDPILGVQPHNIVTKLHNWLYTEEEKKMGSETLSGIISEGWQEKEIEEAEKRYSEECTEWMREKIRNDSMKLIYNKIDEKIDMKKLSENITCSLKFKKI